MTEPSTESGKIAPVEPRMGVDFPLTEFERRILADPDVLGMVYTGSLGRGDGDRCSDLDISLWVRDEAFMRPGLLEHFLGWLGEIHFVYSSRDEHGLSSNCFVGPDWQQAELYIMDSHHPTPHPYWHAGRVVKDTDGRLAGLLAVSGPPIATLTRDAAYTGIVEAIYHLNLAPITDLISCMGVWLHKNG